MGASSGGGGGGNPAPYGRNRDGTPSSQAEREAWNRLKGETGLSGERLYQSQRSRKDPLEDFYAMLESGGGTNHQASSGISQDEQDAIDLENTNNQGLTDLDAGYAAYIGASEDATNFVNDQIETQKSEAALIGSDFSITDQQKADRINDRFADIFDSDQWDKLQKLNNDFGQYRLDNDAELSAYEFLITRGAVSDTDKDTGTKGNQSSAKIQGGSPSGKKESLLVVNPEQNLNKDPINILGG